MTKQKAASPTDPHFLPRSLLPPSDDPDLYGLYVEGDCLAPVVSHGDLVFASPATPPKAGMVVAIWPRDDQPVVKRLLFDVPPPWTPGSTVAGVLIVQTINPPKQLQITMDKIDHVHTVIAVLKPEEYKPFVRAAEGVPAGALIPRYGAAASSGG